MLRKAKSLPCQHSVCEECLESLQKILLPRYVAPCVEMNLQFLTWDALNDLHTNHIVEMFVIRRKNTNMR